MPVTPSKLKITPVVIIAVEPREMARPLFQEVYEKEGFEVHFVNNGIDALNLAKVLKPQLVVTDVIVPKLDGYSLCRLLKDDPKTRSIRILICSYLSAEREALQAGADGFILKPPSAAALRKMLKRLRKKAGAP